MVTITTFSTEKELSKLTGLNHEQLWEAGFNLDDWDFGFRSQKPYRNNWLLRQMSDYCCGCEEVEYNGYYYYITYHS